MSDYTEVTRHGWFGRLGGAVKGMLAGMVVLLAAIVLQFWNEGRTLKRDVALSEGRASVVQVASDAPLAANDLKLVHVTGVATAGEPLVDSVFGVSAPVLALRRRVEMFQWEEKKQRKEEKLVGGGTREVVTYRYQTDWSDDAIDSDRFRDSDAHRNPGELPFRSEAQRADPIRIGAFVLSTSAAAEIGGWQRLAPGQVQLPPNQVMNFRTAGDWLSTSSDPERPQVGDVRVRFDLIPEGPVSVVAQQNADVLGEFSTKGGVALLLVESGELSAAAMFDNAVAGNSMLAWLLRGAGLVLGWIGFGLLLKPLVVLSDVIPIMGRLAGVGVAVVSGLLAAGLSLLAISIGWIWYRPWALGLVLLAVVAAVVWLLRSRSRAPAQPPAAVISRPPPPPPA